MKKVNTYTATIYCGLKEGYSEAVHNKKEVKQIAQKYCDDRGLCVTLTDTEFIYRNGNEPGVAIGLINYPRFPETPINIRKTAIDLAKLVKESFKQNRISIVFSDETIML